MSMGKLQLTDEERQARSERMKQLHAEGKAGGQYGHLGGRPKKKRASEVIAEKVAEEAENIWKNLKELALGSDSEKVRLEASIRLLGIEEQERKVSVEEEVRYEQLKRNELQELVIGNLFELVRSGSIDLGEIIEGEVTEDKPAIGIGESD